MVELSVRPERLLVVVADDFGLSDALSRAIVDAHRSGIVTATSVLANAPAVDAALRLAAEVPDLELGLHGALVGEDPPLSPARDIPTLVDRRGRLAPSWRTLLPRLAVGRIDPADVRRELEAQLAQVRAAGRPVTHLNLHQHLQLWPSVADVVLDLALAEGIPYVRTPRSSRRGPSGIGIGRLADALARRIEGAGLTSSSGFVGLDEAGRWTGARLRGALATSTTDVLEVNVHPGAAGDADLGRYRWGYGWAEEQAALLDERTATVVARSGRRLVGPGQVADRGCGRP